MELNKLVGTIVALTVMVVCVAAILVPVVNDAESTIGEPVTYTNTTYGYALEEMDSATLSATSTGTDGEQTISVNGITVEQIANANTPVIVTDSVAIQVSPTGSGNIFVIRSATGNGLALATTAGDISVTAADGTLTLDVYGTETTYTYTWLYAVSEDGDFKPMTSNLKSAYLSADMDFVLYGYSTTLGYYSYKDGTAASSSDADTTVEYTANLVDGTTDIYQTTSSGVTIGGVTPTWAVLVPSEVEGHSDDGNVALLGAIVPMVIVGMIVIAVGLIRTNKD